MIILYVKGSRSRVARSLQNEHYYVLSKYAIVYKRNDAVYLRQYPSGEVPTFGNTVDAFLIHYPTLRYGSVTELPVTVVTALRRRVVQLAKV